MGALNIPMDKEWHAKINKNLVFSCTVALGPKGVKPWMGGKKPYAMMPNFAMSMMGGMMYKKMILPKIKKACGGDLSKVPNLVDFLTEFKNAMKGTFFGGEEPECVDITTYAVMSIWIFKEVEGVVKSIEAAGLNPWLWAMEQ